jgi:hypothetical protein
MGRALKRIRELEATGKRDLHHHSMRFIVDPTEEIKVTSTGVLFESLSGYTGYDLDAYVGKKSQLLRTLGYGSDALTFEFTSAVELDELVDAFVGLKSGFSVERAAISSTRFGITVSEHTLEKAVLFVQASSGPCQLRATSRRARKRVQVDAEISLPPIPGLPLEALKARVRNEFIDFVFASSGKYNFSFNTEMPYDLTTLTENLEFVCLLMERDAQVELLKDGQFLAGTRSVELATLPPFFAVLARHLRNLLDALPSHVASRIRLTPLSVFAQREAYKYVALAASRSRATATAQIEGARAPLPKGKKGVVAIPVPVEVDNGIVLIRYLTDASFKFDSDSVRMRLSAGQVWDALVFGKSEVAEIEASLREFEEYAQSVAGKGVLLFQQVKQSAVAEPQRGGDVTATT